jgi:hypothetical protein
MHCLFCTEDIFKIANFPAEDIFSILVCRKHSLLKSAEIISRVQEIKASWHQRELILHLADIAYYKYLQYRDGDEELCPNENCATMVQICGEIKAYLFLEPLARDLAFMRDILLERSINGSLNERAMRYNEMIFLIDSWGSHHLRKKYYLPPLALALFQQTLDPLPPPLNMLQ